MEAGRVDAADRIACRDLACRDVGCAVDRELQRDRQLGKIDIVTLDHHLVPGGLRNQLARNVFLAALAKRGRKIVRLNAETSRQQSAIGRDVDDDGDFEALGVFEDDDGVLAGALQFERHRGHFEPRVDFPADAQDLLGEIRLDHLQEAAQALLVDVTRARHRHSHPQLGLMLET